MLYAIIKLHMLRLPQCKYFCQKKNLPSFGHPAWTLTHLYQVLPKLGKSFGTRFLIEKKYGRALLHTNTGDRSWWHTQHSFTHQTHNLLSGKSNSFIQLYITILALKCSVTGCYQIIVANEECKYIA